MRDGTKLCSASSNSGAKSVTGTSSAIVPAVTGGTRVNRKVLIITNCDASASAYLGVGFTPTSSDYSYKLGPASTLHLDVAQFTEAINAISSSGTITVRVYEGA